MITEMVAVEMDIQVAYLDHMVAVAVVEEHITTEEIAPAMRGRILVMMLQHGVQIPKIGMMAWATFLVQRSKTHLEGKLSLVVGVLVEVAVEAAVGVVAVAVAGVKEVVEQEGGVELVQMMLLLIMGLQDGVQTRK